MSITEPKMLMSGSFNPYTIGHHSVYNNTKDILPNAQVIVGITQNHSKTTLNPHITKWITNPVFPNFHSTNLKIVDEPLLADYATKTKCNALVRSLRNSIDLVNEVDLARWNKSLGDIHTIFVPSDRNLDHVSSSAIREIGNLGGDVAEYFASPVQYNRWKNGKPKRIIITGRMGSGKSSFIKDHINFSYDVWDMDKTVKQQLSEDASEEFKWFFETTDVEDIEGFWNENSFDTICGEDDHEYVGVHNAKTEVVSIIDNFIIDKDSRLDYYALEISAFTAYDLKKYYDDSIIVYVDNYDNGKQRDWDVDLYAKSLQLHRVPDVVDFVVNQNNGKLEEVLDAIRKTIL